MPEARYDGFASWYEDFAGGFAQAFADVLAAFAHTDIDDFPSAVAEVARVLRPGGGLVYVGTIRSG